MQNRQLSGSEKVQSIGVRALINTNPESEGEDNPLKASDMKTLKHPAKSLFQNELNSEDEIIAPEEDYHMVTGATRQLHRRISQNSQYSDNTTGSHASQNKSTFNGKTAGPK